jgi:hypothetical protein
VSDDFEQQEYFAVHKLIGDFDQRLITIKGWGVTLSLASLGLGFQYRAFGYFLLAAVSSIAFWAIEGAIKRHQMRFYPRMREIEISRQTSSGVPSVPRIDWSFQNAPAILTGKGDIVFDSVKPTYLVRPYNMTWLLPHIFLPHAVTFIVATILFIMGVSGHLLQFSLGAMSK